MTELISKDEALRICRFWWHPTFNPILEEIQELPTVEAIPVEFVLKRMKEYADDVEDNADLYAIGVLGMLITAWKKENEHD